MMGTRIAFPRSRPSRTSRLLIGSVVLTFVLLGGAGVVTYIAYQQATAELVLERDRELAFFSANRLESELAKLAEGVETLARTEALNQGNFSAQRQALEDARHRLAVYDAGAVLMDSRGIVIGTEPWRPEIHGRDWSNRQFFSRLLTYPSAYISDIVEDGPDGQEVVVISVPIQGGRGEFVGALAGMFKLGEPTVSSLYASVVRLRLPQAGSTYLVDGTGRVLYDSQGAAIGGTLQDVGLAEALTAGGGAYRTRDADGHDIVAASAPIPNTRWTLVLEDDWDILTASSQRYARILIGLLGSGMLLPTVGVALLWRQRNAQVLERELAEQESRLAQLMQAALLPKLCPALSGWMLAAFHQPAESQGRNFYDLLITADGRLMLVLGEMNLAGPAATMAMSIVRSSLRSAARARLSPPEGLLQANAALFPELPQDAWFACVYAVLDPDTGRLEYANAGFNPPSLLGPPDGEPAPPATPLGKELAPTYLSHSIEIQPGGQVVLSGVDLSELSGLRGGPFSLQRAHELLQAVPEDCDDPSEVFATQLRETLGYPARLKCDFTILGLRRRFPS